MRSLGRKPSSRIPALSRVCSRDLEVTFSLRSKAIAIADLGLALGLGLAFFSLQRIFAMGEDKRGLEQYREGLRGNLESGEIPEFVFDFCAFFVGIARDAMPQLYFFGEILHSGRVSK